jgi:peptide/nickel transport system ATP-binding protein
MLLEVEKLNIEYHTPTGTVAAVRDFNLAMGRERIGIVGESGSGKSTVVRAMMGFIEKPNQVSALKVEFDGIDLRSLSEREWLAIRGKRIAMILQDPRYSLNPVITVGRQIAEACRAHTRCTRREADDRALAMLEAVRIGDPRKVFGFYPHQVSGGMGQRVMICMMLVCEPDLLLADEPTSALDVTVQAQILGLLEELVQHKGMGLILVSHNLDLVATFCDRVLIMYRGRIMEACKASELMNATHPYTRGLLACRPHLSDRRLRLPQLERDPAWI